MHDIRLIRGDPTAFDTAIGRLGVAPVSAEILAIDQNRRSLISGVELQQAERNAVAKAIGEAFAAGDVKMAEELKATAQGKRDQINELEQLAKAEDTRLRDMLMGLPNLPYDDVPDGADEADNTEIRRWGEPREFDFKPLEHLRDSGSAGRLDFETAAKLSGARFVVMKGAVARLHRALAQFMLDVQTGENGLTEMITPVLVRDEAMYGTNQLPKFAEDSYQTTNGWWLIPTSEVTLTNTVAGEMLDEADLPRRMTAHTQCFRSEAGSRGQGHRGHAAPAPVREGRDGVDHPSRSLAGRTRAHDPLRRGCSGTPRPALPHRDPLHRRHGVRRPQDP